MRLCEAYERFDEARCELLLRPTAPAWTSARSKRSVCAEAVGTLALDGELIDFEELFLSISRPSPEEDNHTLLAAKNILRALARIFAIRPAYVLPMHAASDCETVLELHEMALEGLVPTPALGVWRTDIEGAAGSFSGQGIPAHDIPDAMARWSQAFAAETYDGHRLARLADAYAVFDRIQPFSIGNGRTGRLLLQSMAIEDGLPFFPISQLLWENRAVCSDILSRAHASDGVDKWRSAFADLCVDAIQRLR
ncbi:MAG TPA: Fic family protein [Magnetospirillaceae bacterium]|jgi:Fic family protein